VHIRFCLGAGNPDDSSRPRRAAGAVAKIDPLQKSALDQPKLGAPSSTKSDFDSAFRNRIDDPEVPLGSGVGWRWDSNPRMPNDPAGTASVPLLTKPLSSLTGVIPPLGTSPSRFIVRCDAETTLWQT
jgi:hypothetical protein